MSQITPTDTKYNLTVTKHVALILLFTPIYVIVMFIIFAAVILATAVGVTWMTVTAPTNVSKIIVQHFDDREKLLNQPDTRG